MTDSLAGFVWFAAPERLLILCALKDINGQDDFARIVNSRSELQGHMCRCSWRSRQGRSRYHQPHIGPVHLWQYEQKDEYKHQDLGISLWRLRQWRHSWKLRQLLPQKCHRRRPGNEKISPKLCSFFLSHQGYINRGTCSQHELTSCHVLTSAYVIIFWTVARNAVNKSVWRKKDCSCLPFNKHAKNVLI